MAVSPHQYVIQLRNSEIDAVENGFTINIALEAVFQSVATGKDVRSGERSTKLLQYDSTLENDNVFLTNRDTRWRKVRLNRSI